MRPERPRAAVTHALIGLATVSAALLVMALSPSCTLDRMGLAGSGGAGGSVMGDECEEAIDCPGLFKDCRRPLCANGTCDTEYNEAGSPCDEDEGKVCNGRGDCVECTDIAHCAPGEICQVNLCVPASCGDGTLNGDETDLDCGGSCGPCDNGKNCIEKTDCISGYCSNAGVCAPCSVSEDCLPTHWCDNGTCVERSENGDLCESNDQCLSGACPVDDGACCDQMCEGLCVACIPGQTGLAPGVCGPVLDGDDFKGECPDEGAASCGSDGTGCNGNGDCRVYPNGTQCGGGVCQSDDEHLPDTCDGNRNCNDGGTIICSPYICTGGHCLTDCDGDGECLTGSYCQNPPNGACVSQGGLGDPCGGNNECDTNFCVDGRCCESACTADCMACNDNLTGLGHGNCRSIPTGVSQPECTNGACYRISPTSGECRLNVGQPCPGGDDDCLNGMCRDGYCCATDCAALCMACDGNHTSGNNGQCANVLLDHDPRGDCTHECDGFAACEGEIGDACPPVAVCNSRNCVDNVCCNTSCTATCQSCDGTYTSGNDGQCLDVVRNEDPRGDCTLPAECDGGGNCEGNIGDGCPSPYPICNSDICADGHCCSTACGECRDCGVSGSEGTCQNMAVWSTDATCTGNNVCNGGGTCVPRCGFEPTPPGGSCPAACTGNCSGTICTILCDAPNECNSAAGAIVCPAGWDCDVQCVNNQACQDNTITCPADYACSVTCTGNQACGGTTVTCSQRGTCALSCSDTGGGEDCLSAVLNCGYNTCTASCTADTTRPTVNCDGTWGCTCTPCPPP